jgi:hypothetical protein
MSLSNAFVNGVLAMVGIEVVSSRTRKRLAVFVSSPLHISNQNTYPSGYAMR